MTVLSLVALLVVVYVVVYVAVVVVPVVLVVVASTPLLSEEELAAFKIAWMLESSPLERGSSTVSPETPISNSLTSGKFEGASAPTRSSPGSRPMEAVDASNG
eukprot:CAMPEP_0194519056 /NCGR_PEP_ID=MMETSP0253-20130528/52613_1 /TAXON_ID=2966 /ORGANISM="Noctiluca scintillans" /LENGTH=102 /DNA_ID=CAMNT_0039363145 /DNA_START=372 /DNA_END=680 /DNA_ORIENTATION=+